MRLPWDGHRGERRQADRREAVGRRHVPDRRAGNSWRSPTRLEDIAISAEIVAAMTGRVRVDFTMSAERRAELISWTRTALHRSETLLRRLAIEEGAP
jgi:hypothetical protein